MLHLLAPDVVSTSLFHLPLDALANRGVRGLLVDLDNTLIPYRHRKATPEALSWIAQAQERGFGVCITSNARRARVQYFSRALGVPGIANAAKPLARPFYRGMALLATNPKQTAIIGDQLFTDVLGGNRLGLHTVLVNPLSDVDLGATKLMRRLERRAWHRLYDRGFISEADWRIRATPEAQDYPG